MQNLPNFYCCFSIKKKVDVVQILQGFGYEVFVYVPS